MATFIDKPTRSVADVSYVGPKILYFNRINVPKQHRRKGIGTTLLLQVIEYAKAEKALLMCPVSPSGEMNKRQLIRWYKSHGFRQTDKLDDPGALEIDFRE